MIDTNAVRIKGLGRHDSAPSGNVLREAGRPLREGAGRVVLSITSAIFAISYDLTT